MAELRVTKPDEAYLDLYEFANTTPELINGIVAKEVRIYPRKFPAGWNTVAFPFDVTVDELKEIFGSDTKIWAYYDIQWKDTTYGSDTNGWNYNDETGEVISQSHQTPPESEHYTHYVLYVPDENQTTGKIKANTPFLMRTSQSFLPSEETPLVFYNKTFVVPDKVQFYKVEKDMYMYSNMYYMNGDVCTAWNLDNVVKCSNDLNKPFFILSVASNGALGYINSRSLGMQCTGAGFFKVRKDSGWY